MKRALVFAKPMIVSRDILLNVQACISVSWIEIRVDCNPVILGHALSYPLDEKPSKY